MKAGEALRLSLPAVLLLIGFSAWTQQSSVQAPNSATDEVPQFSLEAKSFIDALLKVSARFQFPLGVEWVKTADTLRPVRFSRTNTTVKDIMTHLRVNCGETVDSNGVIGAAPILCRQIRTEIAGEPTSR